MECNEKIKGKQNKQKHEIFKTDIGDKRLG